MSKNPTRYSYSNRLLRDPRCDQAIKSPTAWYETKMARMACFSASPLATIHGPESSHQSRVLTISFLMSILCIQSQQKQSISLQLVILVYHLFSSSPFTTTVRVLDPLLLCGPGPLSKYIVHHVCLFLQTAHAPSCSHISSFLLVIGTPDLVVPWAT